MNLFVDWNKPLDKILQMGSISDINKEALQIQDVTAEPVLSRVQDKPSKVAKCDGKDCGKPLGAKT